MTLKELFKDEKPHYRRLFIELCKRVGAKLEDIELKKERETWAFPHTAEDLDSSENGTVWEAHCSDRWAFPYEAYTWTKEEEDSFRDWLVEYVYKYRRKFKLGYASKKWIRDKEASMFILNYSWKYSE